MPNLLARFLSYLFHPALMPLAGFGLLMYLHPYPIESGVLVYTLSFLVLGTYIMPGFISVLFVKMGLIDSLHMRDAESRRWPFLVAVVFYVFTALYLKVFPIPQETPRYLLGAAAGIGTLIILLPILKASAHMAGIGGFLALVYYLGEAYQVDLYTVFLAAVLCSGVVASARLALGAHDMNELIIGFLCGFSGVLSVMMWFQF